MSILDYEAWQGNPKEATQEVAALLLAHHPGVMPPTERVLRKWRQEDIISRTGRRFTGRNVLEAAYVAWQRREGVTLIAVATQLQSMELLRLRENVLAGNTVTATAPIHAAAPIHADDRRLEQLMTLLAHGILKQFQAVQAGRAVGVGLTDAIGTREVIPLPLRQAQTQLARLAFENGQEDECASVHELLWRCTMPLNQWAPRPLAEHPNYNAVVLIDAEYRVPSPACEDFGEAGGHLADLVEIQIYRGLRQALDQLDESERDATYTLMRRFIAEHPMVSRTGPAWRRLWASPRLNPAAREWLRFVYEPAHAALANRQGLVAQCAHCQAPLASHRQQQPACTLSACRAAHPRPLATSAPLPLADALVARPEVLRYWCNPALDELRLFRELTVLFPDEEVQLYPYQDLCDVAVGTRLGFDVKDYADPILLARKLNRGVGGLRLYDTMVVAVAERQVINRPEYLPQVYDNLQTALRRSLRVLSVDNILETLRRDGHLS